MAPSLYVSERPAIDFDFRFMIDDDYDPQWVVNRLWMEGLSGCYVARAPWASGVWLINLTSRDPDAAERLLKTVRDLLAGLFADVRGVRPHPSDPPERGLAWVYLNGPHEGLGYTEAAKP